MSRLTITAADRLSLTVFFAAVAHAMVILGIGFGAEPPKPRREAPLIEITLADNPIEIAPKDYDYLAQANQDGGGENSEKQRPRKAEQALVAGEPDGHNLLQAAPAPSPPPQDRQQRVVTSMNGELTASAQSSDAAFQHTESNEVDLINAERQVAQWSVFREDRDSALPKFPSKRRIDARTKAHAAAAYMHAWLERVEQIGNLNYPEEAVRRGLSGSLILEVTLRPDGSVYDLRVLKPSRHPVLDQAAMRTVRLASPFPPVTEEAMGGHDLLVITRTWEFVHTRGLSTR